MAKTSATDPIWVTKIEHPDHPGKIGVSICPGKKSPSVFGGTWDRDLVLDLISIQRDLGTIKRAKSIRIGSIDRCRLLHSHLQVSNRKRKRQSDNVPPRR